jgi:predicted O-linked N-acetylglucosamine transferase (SPINDLY family)
MLKENETQYFSEQPVYLLPSFYAYHPAPSCAEEARKIRGMVENAIKASAPFPSNTTADRSEDACPSFPPLPILPLAPVDLGLPDRADLGIPPKENGTFVFFNFAEPHKIDRQTFSAWMQILNLTDNTVLLLASGASNESNSNMKKYASARGVDPKRIIFTAINGVPWLLRTATEARHILSFVDLYLDTFSFSTDVLNLVETLYLDVPVLALRGKSFKGMVSTSFLKAVGLPELVAQNKARYVTTAVMLVRSTREDSATLTANTATVL